MKLRSIIFVLLLACAGTVQAFVNQFDGNGNLILWNLNANQSTVPTNSFNPTTQSIRFYLASDGFSTTNTTAELNAIRASFDQWQSVPGTRLKFEYAGLVPPQTDINTGDQTNIIFWVKNSPIVNGGRDNISGALGVTYTTIVNAQITQADIVLNGYNYDWFTTLGDPAGDNLSFIEGTVTHEIGHFLGLNHSPIGAATMFNRGDTGSEATQIGLSSDEVAAARYLYPTNGATAVFGTIGGHVSFSGGGSVFGASIVVETSAGNIVAGTVSEVDGSYALPALPAGTYLVRVTPLNPSNASRTLVQGQDIAFDYSTAMTNFGPATNSNVTVTGGNTATVNFSVTTGSQPFFISDIRAPTTNPNSFGTVNSAVAIHPGQSNYVIGVFGANLPTQNATLQVTGDGLTLGNTTFVPNLNFGNGIIMNCMSVAIGVSSNATPGMRSFVVTSNSVTTWANGFIEVLPVVPDNNFDGLDDTFQRKYFSRFTAPEAAPTADPDNDGFNNLAEYIAGTNPTDGSSFLKLSSITQTVSGATITWQSVAGKKYQVYSRGDFTGSVWHTVGNPVAANGATAQYFDATGTGTMNYYRVQVLP